MFWSKFHTDTLTLDLASRAESWFSLECNPGPVSSSSCRAILPEDIPSSSRWQEQPLSWRGLGRPPCWSPPGLRWCAWPWPRSGSRPPRKSWSPATLGSGPRSWARARSVCCSSPGSPGQPRTARDTPSASGEPCTWVPSTHVYANTCKKSEFKTN